MPFTPAQCRALFAKRSRGERVPGDLRKHCRKGGTKRKATGTKRNPMKEVLSR